MSFFKKDQSAPMFEGKFVNIPSFEEKDMQVKYLSIK